MTVYKLFRCKNGDSNLYPLYVLASKPCPRNKVLKAECGKLLDATHVKASGCGGKLRLRGGWHSTTVPFTDWIGKRDKDGTLIQRKDTVWCECEVLGNQIECNLKNGFEMVPQDSWYYFKTNSKQKEPWIISDKIIIKRTLSDAEVEEICKANGYEPQRKEVVA